MNERPASPPRPRVRVRPARLDDLEFLVAGNAAMARETEGRTLRTAVLRRGVRAALRDPGLGFYLVAERGGVRVGQLLVTREWSDWRNGPIWWIQSVYVVPPARRTGVYAALHAAVRTRARRAGGVRAIRLYVEGSNRAARRVYAALGMEETGYRVCEQPVGRSPRSNTPPWTERAEADADAGSRADEGGGVEAPRRTPRR